MTSLSPGSERPAVAEPDLRPKRGIPLIWAVPLVAVLIGLWLAYTAYTQRGPVVEIAFQTAEGLEAGKTKIRYRDVEVGEVEDVGVSEDLASIVVRARIHPDFATHITTGTRFWVVRPRIGGGGVSGLGTLVSGAYVEVDPGEGGKERSFKGLEEPPLIRSDAAGTQFVLQTESLRSVTRGAPVFYRGIEAGQVLGFTLAEDFRTVEVVVFVRAPYDRLVKPESRFWSAGGITVETGAEGLAVRMGSVQSLLVGGIEFDAPGALDGRPAPAEMVFTLYPDRNSVEEARFARGVPFLVRFDGSVRGLRPGAPVEFRGIRVGRVRDVRLAIDTEKRAIDIPVVIELQPERIHHTDGIVRSAEEVYEGVAELVERGLRAQLVTGNLLTGELVVQLDFQDGGERAELVVDDIYPRIPAIPTTLESLTAAVEDVMAKLQDMPLEQLVAELRAAAGAASELVSSPGLGRAVSDIAEAAAAARTLMSSLEGGSGPLMDSVTGAARAAREATRQAEDTLASLSELMGGRSGVRFQLDSAVQEITAAARALRSLAEYLERNPDALIRGKRGGR